jgi:hypothetical protein
MAELIGIDQESHLHTPGGPLHESPLTHCDGCRWPIPDGEELVLDDLTLCPQCARLSALEVLIEADPGQEPGPVEAQALGILRAFLARWTE